MKKIILTLAALLTMAPAARAVTTDAMLDSLQYGAFRFFWDEANPANGLIRDRSQPGSPCSIASVGFGLTAICIGVDHGYVSRATAASRVLTTLETFWNGPQSSAETGTIGNYGFFYHFLDMNTATRAWSSELSTIDTALLMAGILDSQQYFDSPVDPTEIQIRALADSIYRRANWYLMRNYHPGIQLCWKPTGGFGACGSAAWQGYNEAMIMYILALGSPTHPVPSSDWTYWCSTYDYHNEYGYSYIVFPPLFGHQYSHMWVDFRNIRDSKNYQYGLTYFENSRRATLAQHAYCIANPGGWLAYNDTTWGLTAGDGPFSYNARGAPPAQNDDGTIAPTAAISSLPFAPEVVIPTIRNFYDNYKSVLWGPYGFRDGFNVTYNWYATDVIGIDQGPIIGMIENYRTGAVWTRMMQNPYVLEGLRRAYFDNVPLAVGEPGSATASLRLEQNSPNPFIGASTIRYLLPRAARVRLSVYDLAGREVARLVDADQSAGPHQARFAARGLPSGIYHYQIEAGGERAVKSCVILR